MEEVPRYEIVDTIGTGDFAVVYRARDRELGREVAIKQIHQQYLADQRQLARYWQEAQLLASLQHPNILTIYDIVRSKGWLIVELMRGSLQPAAQSEGIDLDFLRIALAGCLNALQFLHSKGVIHGDVKPSNMLVDAQGRVKLGDFGLARRASNEGGSLLKGATKYMAPELLSTQFGPVGPPSDLYSLGFAAYELMCGAQFETLFPGLSSFGGDKQIAWMMWHAAADRKIPQISRVLEGVPDDLARVIQRLVVKDQSRRYRSAKEALRDLQLAPVVGLTRPDESDAAAEAAKAAAAKRKRRMRYAAILTAACSLVLCVAILLWPGRQPVSLAGAPPIRGVVTNVYPNQAPPAFAIAQTEDGAPAEIKVYRDTRIFINDEPRLLRNLQAHDQVVVTELLESGRKIKEIRAFRPEIANGEIKEVKAAEGRFTLTAEAGEGKSKELVVAVPPDLPINFNGRNELAGELVRIGDLRPGDRVVVHHLGKETGREATELSVERTIAVEGKISEVREVKNEEGKSQQRLTLNIGTGDKEQLIDFPFAAECEITINDRRLANQQVLKPGDLKPGDKATVTHDSRIVKVGARRIMHDSGTIQRVQGNVLEVVRKDDGKVTTYGVGENCAITFGGEPAKLADLRDGDDVEIAHLSLDGKDAEAVSVAAQRRAEPTRWAILVGVDNYEDRSVTRPQHAVADAKLFRDVLVGRYQVPADQALLLSDESRARLLQSVPEHLGRIGPDGMLLIFVTARACKDEEGKTYLALRDFDRSRIGGSGLALQWLVDELEKCPAKEKLLLLDTGHAGAGADLATEPSAGESLESLEHFPGRRPLRTVTAIASCGAGQRSVEWPEKQHGLFAWLLAQGYAGAADRNRDHRVDPTELFGYLEEALAAATGPLKVSQTAELILPDDRPPRLTEEARTAIRKLAAHLDEDRIKAADAKADYELALQAAGKEPEPKLLYGLVLLKSKQREAAARHFDEIAAEFPDALLPLEVAAWLRFEKRTYPSGLKDLVALVSKIPKPKKAGSPYEEDDLQVFCWVGQLREFAAITPDARLSADSLTSLDAALGRHGPDAQRSYEEGREKSRAVRDDFTKRIEEAESEAVAMNLTIQRRAVTQYVHFPYDQALQQVLAGMDQ